MGKSTQYGGIKHSILTFTESVMPKVEDRPKRKYTKKLRKPPVDDENFKTGYFSKCEEDQLKKNARVSDVMHR